MKISTVLLVAGVVGVVVVVMRRRSVAQSPLAGTPGAGTIIDPSAWGAS